MSSTMVYARLCSSFVLNASSPRILHRCFSFCLERQVVQGALTSTFIYACTNVGDSCVREKDARQSRQCTSTTWVMLISIAYTLNSFTKNDTSKRYERETEKEKKAENDVDAETQTLKSNIGFLSVQWRWLPKWFRHHRHRSEFVNYSSLELTSSSWSVRCRCCRTRIPDSRWHSQRDYQVETMKCRSDRSEASTRSPCDEDISSNGWTDTDERSCSTAGDSRRGVAGCDTSMIHVGSDVTRSLNSFVVACIWHDCETVCRWMRIWREDLIDLLEWWRCFHWSYRIHRRWSPSSGSHWWKIDWFSSSTRVVFVSLGIERDSVDLRAIVVEDHYEWEWGIDFEEEDAYEGAEEEEEQSEMKRVAFQRLTSMNDWFVQDHADYYSWMKDAFAGDVLIDRRYSVSTAHVDARWRFPREHFPMSQQWACEPDWKARVDTWRSAVVVAAKVWWLFERYLPV